MGDADPGRGTGASPLVTIFSKARKGLLSKRLFLTEEGALGKDSSACMMSSGDWATMAIACDEDFARMLEGLGSHQAIALGAMNAALECNVNSGSTNGPTTGGRVVAVRDATEVDIFHRTKDCMSFPAGREGRVLLDVDLGKAPQAVREKLATDGAWDLLCNVLPGLIGAARVERPSVSCRVLNGETGAWIEGSSGLHIYPRIADASDASRVVEVIHDRLLLADLGWIEISRSGARLVRTLVDKAPRWANSLSFEGAPLLDPPLSQPAEVRKATAHPGEVLDSWTAIRDLDAAERAQREEIVGRLKAEKAEEAARVTAIYDRHRVEDIVERSGARTPEEKVRVRAEAKAAVARMRERKAIEGAVSLHFDNGDVVPARSVFFPRDDGKDWHGMTLADPGEPEYGRGKAKLYVNGPGHVVIHSLAHGVSTTWRVFPDEVIVERLLSEGAADAEMRSYAKRVAAIVGWARLAPITEAAAISRLSSISGIGKMPIKRELNEARRRAEAAFAHCGSADGEEDPHESRPQFILPGEMSPLAASVAELDEILAHPTSARTPMMRSLAGGLATIRTIESPGLDELRGTEESARLARPRISIADATDSQVSLRVEDFVDIRTRTKSGDLAPARLTSSVLSALRELEQSKIPKVRTVITLPFVLPSGALKFGEGFDRASGLYFALDPVGLAAARAIARRPTDQDAAAAYRFLADDLFGDVLADRFGVAFLVARLLTVVQRVMTLARPLFLTTAAMPETGKTTVERLVSLATLGQDATVRPWSPSEEERRKSIVTVLARGLPAVTFDNVPNGLRVRCSILEMVLTSEVIEDRRLGASEDLVTHNATVFSMTGNHLMPTSDFATRVLVTTLRSDTDRPAARTFRHDDFVSWVLKRRQSILEAILTLLVWNPALYDAGIKRKTRFREWYLMCGFPVELAFRMVHGVDLDLERDGFEAVKEEDEAANARKALLAILLGCFGEGERFDTKWILNVRQPGIGLYFDPRKEDADKSSEDELRERLDDLLVAIAGKDLPYGGISSKVIGNRLQVMVDRPETIADGRLAVLRRQQSGRHASDYHVEVMQRSAG